MNKSDKNTKNIKNMPEHVAVIMDGNGRWAQAKGFPRIYGHHEGAKRIREIVKVSAELGIKALTLYAFSTENWKRPKNEVNELMSLLSEYLKNEIKKLHKNNIVFRVIGDIAMLKKHIQDMINQGMLLTKDNTGLILNIAINYGARAEIIQAVNKILKDKKRDIFEDDFKEYLYTKDLPDPDLLIRTGGEMRVSNFLLWQIAYSEIMVVQTFWPEFKKKNFFEVLDKYSKRIRRFGG
ncbi:isoprenyl transferase [bacterium]